MPSMVILLAGLPTNTLLMMSTHSRERCRLGGKLYFTPMILCTPGPPPFRRGPLVTTTGPRTSIKGTDRQVSPWEGCHLYRPPEIPGVCRVLEGVGAYEHDIQRDPARPHVRNLARVLLPREDLWGNVGRGAHSRLGLRVKVRGLHTGKASGLHMQSSTWEHSKALGDVSNARRGPVATFE